MALNRFSPHRTQRCWVLGIICLLCCCCARCFVIVVRIRRWPWQLYYVCVCTWLIIGNSRFNAHAPLHPSLSSSTFLPSTGKQIIKVERLTHTNTPGLLSQQNVHKIKLKKKNVNFIYDAIIIWPMHVIQVTSAADSTTKDLIQPATCGDEENNNKTKHTALPPIRLLLLCVCVFVVCCLSSRARTCMKSKWDCKFLVMLRLP